MLKYEHSDASKMPPVRDDKSDSDPSEQASGNFKVETAIAASIGGREEQQDRVDVCERDGARLFVLADGLGGHSGGTLSAQAVIDAARDCFDVAENSHSKHLLPDITLAAHKRINHVAEENKLIRLRSACVLLLITGTQALWSHVEDSRLYHLRDGRLVGRTIDHTHVELQRTKGVITDDEMKIHPEQNRLRETVGGYPDPIFYSGERPGSWHDGFLLCSDGLCGTCQRL